MKISGKTTHSVILFDGVCNLCNGFVRFVIKRDPDEKFKFAALQSNAGQALLRKYNIRRERIETVVLIEGEQKFMKSEAVFKIIRIMGGRMKILLIFNILPRTFTNYVYDVIAKKRYRIFGKKKKCMIPTTDIRKRFLI